MTHENAMKLEIGDIVIVHGENHFLDIGTHGIILSIDKKSKYYWTYKIMFQNNSFIKLGMEFVEDKLGTLV